MHPCDKCKRYDKCYPSTMTKQQADAQRQSVVDFGCKLFKELTVPEMFGVPVRKEEQ